MTKQKIYLSVINIFIVLTVIILAATIYLTTARVTISVPTDRVEFKNTASISVANQTGDNAIYGDVISKNFEEKGDFPVGTSKTTSNKAGGMITITNTTGSAQRLQ